jgi:hypothetical protein
MPPVDLDRPELAQLDQVDAGDPAAGAIVTTDLRSRPGCRRRPEPR